MPTSPTSGPGGGSSAAGLPSQWSADAHGGVVATVDANNTTALEIDGKAGQTADLLDVLNSNGLGVTIRKTGRVTIAPDTPDNTALEVYGSGGGTSPIATFANGFSGSQGLLIDKDGYPILLLHAAPADAALDPGSCTLWFDQTDGVGNTKLMVKAKSADGTVKTATIVLA